jgi:cobaltochelatase CobT
MESGPRNPEQQWRRVRDAIGACTRTIGEASDTDAALARADAITVGSLRAAADRVALRRRFLDEGLEQQYRPVEPLAAAIFDAVSQARLDALGASWLAGIAHNLLAFPGTDDDGVRWLAFESFAARDAPPEKIDVVVDARRALDTASLSSLDELRNLLHDQRRFLAAAAEWARRAAPRVPAHSAPAAANRFAIPRRPVGTDIRRGRYALPGATRANEQDATAGDADAAQTLPQVTDPVAALIGYRAYTTAFDRVVQASSLVRRDELLALRAKLEADFSPMRSMVARLAKRLMRVLMARQAREWRFDQDDGLLDAARLSAFVASGTARPFKQEFDSPFPSTAVTLLIDHSGSMRGRPMQIAALTVEIIARVLERCGVRCEVLGFTTRDWDGGEPARKWAADGYPEQPGRLNALEHIVIKGADVPWRRARVSLGLFLHDEMLKENIDGEAVAWAHGRLMARGERRRILIVISDGTPMDEATFAANGFEYLDGHLAAIVEDIERRSAVQLAAIGIGHDVSRFYRNATRISRIDDLGPALTSKLIALLGDR